VTRPVRLVLVLSENWTLADPRDLRGLVRMAVEAEDAGFDAVMLSEHVVLGPSAGEQGLMANPREYALPGNQDPRMPWPSSTVLLSAVAAATTRIRLAAAAIIAPLRHPLLLAKDLATLDLLSEGRLVVLPTVSWHRDEYAALGVDFSVRGALLDEHLAAWHALWAADGPVSFEGEHYRFDEVFLEPKPYRPDGVRLWFGGSSLHPRLLRRLVRYGHGLNPLGPISDDDLERMRAALREAGRDPDEIELVGGVRGRFPDADSVADLDEALAAIPAQVARGFDSICIKPSQYLDDRSRFAEWCRQVVERVGAVQG
jgi:probable F420-dependent oxidoreductase